VNRRPAPAIERFMEKVDFSGDCYEWTANRNPHYGQFWDGERFVGAHRWAYETFVGPVPEGLHVLHTCDNRGCVNPDHLWVGTPQDNMDDMARKGRRVRAGAAGEAHPNAKLTAADVVAIRADKRTNKAVAADYGVTWYNVNAIRRRVAWAHVPAQVTDVLRNGLTRADVMAIRADTRPQSVIAVEYGVAQSTVSRIKSGVRRRRVA
jgi:hypothetical protein